MAKPLREKLTYFLLLPAALFLALGAPLVLFGIGTESDFINYYAAGKLVQERQGVRLYDDAAEMAVQRTFTNHAEPLVYNHPPYEAIVFVPFAYLPFRAAFLAWIYASLTMLGAALYVVRREIARLGTLERLIGLLFLFFPLLALFIQGQDSLLVLLSFALTFGALRNGKLFPAGLAMSVASVKPQLMIPFLAICLLGIRRRFFLGLAAGWFVLGAISLAVAGWHGSWQYPSLLVLVATPAGLRRFHIAPWSMPNLRGLAYFALPDVSRGALIAAVVLVSVVLVAAATPKTREALKPSSGSFEMAFAFAILLAMLTSYHLFLYDVCVAALPVVLLLSQARKEPWDWTKKLLHFFLGAFGFSAGALLGVPSDKLCLLCLPLAGLAWAAWLARDNWRQGRERVAGLT